MKDLYYILGAERDCTPGELNAAYRKLAGRLQPGENEHDHFLEDHLLEITEAYQILSDPDKRRKYDLAFKKDYQRRLYYFKIKHLNVAAALALLLFAGLFGWYVMRVINSDKASKPLKTASDLKAPAPTPKAIAHHKKKYSGKTASMTTGPRPLTKDTASFREIKPETLSKETPPAELSTQEQGSLSYSTYLQSNLTGVIYLHERANYTSAVVAKIPNRSAVKVLEKGREFYKVSFNEQTGYVPKWTVTDP